MKYSTTSRAIVVMLGVISLGAPTVGAAAVGRTPGQFDVSSRGDATYRIPISLPSGTNGMTPQLSLSYSSGNANGWLGMGFTIPEFSMISRCSRTYAQDGTTGGYDISFTTSDVLCIDGNRLRMVTGSTYGAANTVYQTELETFRKITITGADVDGPTGFEVRNPDGRIYKYGTTTDSKIRLVTAAGALTTIRLHWALSRIEDRSGNSIDFTYAQESRGGYWPSEIRYTSHTGGTSPLYKVVFVNDSTARPDEILNKLSYTGTVATPKFDFTKRLSRIDVIYMPTSAIVRQYKFTYLPQSSVIKHSFIDTVQECGVGGTECLTPTTFAWNQPTLTQGGVITGPSIPAGVATYFLDLNGDLRSDVLWSSATGAGTWQYALANTSGGFDATQNTGIANTNQTTVQLIEWDGDGRLDLIFSGTDNTWKVLRSNGAGFDATVSTGIAYNAISGFADINGDGRDDLLYSASTSSGLLKFRLNTGGAFGAETTGWTYAWAITKIYSPPANGKRQDFDGDSLEDLIVQYDQVTVGGSTVTHNYKLKAIHGAGTALRLGVEFGVATYLGAGDFNGDKRADIAYAVGTQIYTTVSATAGPTLSGVVVIGDWDGYGRDDLLISSGGIWQYFPSLGTSFGTGTSTGVSAAGGTTAADFDADGVADLLGVASGAVKVVGHYSLVPWPLYGTMLSATDGFGIGATFDYKLLTDPVVHTPGTPAFPYAAVTRQLPLVRTLTATDGVTGTSTYSQTFKYENGRQHLTGRGFVGFTKRTVQDSRTPEVRIEETYRQDFPYIGSSDSRKLIQNTGGQTVRSVTNTWAKISYTNRDFPYVSQSVSEQYEMGGASNGVKYSTITTYVDAIDSTSGLKTDVRTTIAENATGLYTSAVTTRRTWISSVLNDTTNWCLGRPQTIQQINSHTTMPGGTQLTRTSSSTWDGVNCRLQQQKVAPNDPLWEVTTAYGYDAFGNVNLTTLTPAANQGQAQRQSSAFWGADGRAPRTITNAKNHQTQLTWDFDAGTAACPAASAVLGKLRCSTDPNLLTTRFDYDALGRLTREQRPDGTATDFSLKACDAANNYCGVSGLDSYLESASKDTFNVGFRTDTQYFDGFGRLRYDYRKMLNGGDVGTTTSYDALGRVSAQSVPYIQGSSGGWNTAFSYDALGRPTQTVRQTNENDTSASTTQVSYQGLKVVTTDPLNHSTTAIQSAAGSVVQMIDAANNDTDYEYDPFGNLLKTRDYNGNEVTLTYNVRGMKMSSDDPDMGHWSYNYYPLGELKTQTDAKTQVLTLTYDELSRPLSRSDQPEGMTYWTWDTATKGVGKLNTVTSPGGYAETYTYDSLGRAQTFATLIDGSTYTYTYAYNPTQGMLQTVEYPSSVGTPFKTQYDYDYGQLRRVKDFYSPSTVYWQANATNAFHQTIDEQLGSGLRTITTYDQITGRVNRIDSGFGSGSAEQQLKYTWNKAGSLEKREDLNQGTLNETFEYDAMDRLDIVRRNGSMTLDMAYDAIGNITNKSDVGASAFTYDSTRKHAVTLAGSNTYAYDANGNANSRNGQSISWYSYNLPYQINAPGGKYAKFWYGVDRQRYKQEHHAYVGAGTLRTTIYAGGMFEKVTDGSSAPYFRHYVVANGRSVAVYAKTDNAGTIVSWTAYPSPDHLGSVDAVLTGPSDVKRRYSYDAFGKRRGTSWTGSPSNADLDLAWHDSSNRGFTGHEHLDNVGGLIHMNGRVYDPDIGRFLSADPYVQAPYNSQSLNRYSYVFNNPLSFTDPSGYCTEWGWFDFCWDFDITLGGFWDWPTPQPYDHPIYSNEQRERAAAEKNVDGTKVPATVMAIQSHPILPYANAYHDAKAAASELWNEEQFSYTGCDGVCQGRLAGDAPRESEFYTRESVTTGNLIVTGTTVLAPEVLGPEAAVGGRVLESAAARGGGEATRVGRWMSQQEFTTMSATGKVVEGAGGRTYVLRPPNPASYSGARPGSVYAEFNVPSGVLKPASKPEWSVIPGPNVTTRMYGPPPVEMPPATCIVCVTTKGP